MHFTPLNILSTVTIAFYSPFTLLSIYLCFRHGFSPNTGFIFLIFFSLIRISGSALNLASIHTSPMQAGILNTASLVLSFTGISPLLLAALGLVYRIRFGMVKIYPTTIKPIHLVILRIPVMAALVLCDEGAIEYGARIGATGIYKIPITSKIGVILFLVVSIATAIVTVFLFNKRFRFDDSDQYVLYAVAASLPFIFARVIYGFLGAWAPDPSFGFFGGSVLLQGCVSVLPEMIVVVIYSVLGVVLPRRVRMSAREEDGKKEREERRKTKIVLVKPWKVVDVDVEKGKTTTTSSSVQVDGQGDTDQEDGDGDVDAASIQGRLGEDLQDSSQEDFVPIGARESVVGDRYLGIVTREYLPPLTRIDSAIVFDDKF